MVDIQLMYAQQWPEHHQQFPSSSTHHGQSIQAQQQMLQQQILLARGGRGGGGDGGGGMGMGSGIGTGAGGGAGHSGVGVSSESMKRPEKPLRELLEEQDIGKLVNYVCSTCMYEFNVHVHTVIRIHFIHKFGYVRNFCVTVSLFVSTACHIFAVICCNFHINKLFNGEIFANYGIYAKIRFILHLH